MHLVIMFIFECATRRGLSSIADSLNNSTYAPFNKFVKSAVYSLFVNNFRLNSYI